MEHISIDNKNVISESRAIPKISTDSFSTQTAPLRMQLIRIKLLNFKSNSNENTHTA